MVFQFHTLLSDDRVGFAQFTAEHEDDRRANLAASIHGRICDLAAQLGRHAVEAIGNAVVRSESPRWRAPESCQ
jgi:hypothetical protein